MTGCDNLEELLLLMQTACNNIGLELGTDMYLAMNCAAHELMDYVSYFQYLVCWVLKGVELFVNIVYYHIANSPKSFLLCLLR